MSAGSGVRHSEVNPSLSEWAHLLQIWILPDQKGYAPRYGQLEFDFTHSLGRWLQLIGIQDPAHPAAQSPSAPLEIRQDVKVFLRSLKMSDRASYSLSAGRGLWLQVVKGQISASSSGAKAPLEAGAGDALFCESAGPEVVEFFAHADTEVLLFDII